MCFQAVLLFVILISFIFVIFDVKRFIRNQIMFAKLPGPKQIPFVGLIEFALIKEEDVMNTLYEYLIAGNKAAKCWLGGVRFFSLYYPEDLEVALSSTSYITKGTHYDSVKEWLREGLLTSSGNKWHTRRKLLTPAFHFKILEDSIPVINRNAKILAKKLLATNGQSVDVHEYITLCTLDVICETAMGVKLQAQDNQQKQYVKDIKRICALIVKKELRYWFKYFNFLWDLASYGPEMRRILGRLHGFTEKVIAERKDSYQPMDDGKAAGSGRKKRKAFLDCLIDYEMKNPGSLSLLDMREEVDTFMFEGHDTTSVSIMFTLYMFGLHPEIQDKAVQEIEDIFGDSDRDVEMVDLSKMQYLEMCIKESLRLFPSVPYMSRNISADFALVSEAGKGIVVPEGTNLVIFPFFHHRNPDTFPDPERFDPERFTEENSKFRHPFAYFPFSAGPRNCIGQKFAMMELKMVISTILRYNVLKSLTDRTKIKFAPLLMLRTDIPILLEFAPRNLVKTQLNGEESCYCT